MPYVYWCRRYILYHNKRHPLDMGKQEIETFLTHLGVDRATPDPMNRVTTNPYQQSGLCD